ncbi:MAG: hypothetical protein ACLP0B_14945 [Steroidobacteraceae bacterium]
MTDQTRNNTTDENEWQCPICGSKGEDDVCLNPKRREDDQRKLWRGAFYDTAYGHDQTARMRIFDNVAGFLLSIGCRLEQTCAWDGSDNDSDYGWFICTVIYRGKRYRHNPCYRLRCELPVELIEKLDAQYASNVLDVQFASDVWKQGTRYLCAPREITG